MNYRSQGIVVDGATGYVGTHLVSRLAEMGCQIRCLVHRKARTGDLDFLKQSKGTVVVADLNEEEKVLAPAFASAASVVHLVGSIAPRAGESFETLHAGATARIVELAERFGLGKIVMVTALGANRDSPSRYQRSKWQAEEVIRNSGLAHVILRPSLIVGRYAGTRDSKLVGRYRQLIARHPAVPVIAGGKNKVQPVFIGDLVEALVAVLVSDQWNGRTLEIGGPEVVTMHELVRLLMECTSARKPLIAIPPFLADLAAGVCEAAQDRPLVSRDQVVLSRIDNICTENALQEVLSSAPTLLAEAVESYRQAPPNYTGSTSRISGECCQKSTDHRR